MKKVSIIGTVGVPANYGGFESLVENIIGENTSPGILYTIYCSSKNYTEKLDTYKGAKLKYIPLDANGVQSIFYDIISLIKASANNDTIVILGVSGCIFLPIYRIFSKKRLVINIDGLEHKRDKWGKWAKRFLKLSEKMAVKYANVIITDNKGIQDYVKEEYSKNSVLIAYGGDHVLQDIPENECISILDKYNVEKNKYCFSVCRIEPENNVHVTLEAFGQLKEKIIFVGNWNRSVYGKELYDKYKNYKNIILLESIYDLKTLYALRKNCKAYIHGHSAGGTNPSLVEAMFFNIPIIAYDVVYNRETTENKALYFSNPNSLIKYLNQSNSILKKCANEMFDIANKRYKWCIIAKQYEELY